MAILTQRTNQIHMFVDHIKLRGLFVIVLIFLNPLGVAVSDLSMSWPNDCKCSLTTTRYYFILGIF